MKKRVILTPIAVVLFLCSPILVTAFKRYTVIKSVSSYRECEDAPLSITMVIGVPVCQTLYGERFEEETELPTENNDDVDLTIVLDKEWPPILYKYPALRGIYLKWQSIRSTVVNVKSRAADKLLMSTRQLVME